MAFDADEEILQDFLVEAGEILELLSEQLVRLEREPDDLPLLNAIFRGFHTVKGGAGFLKLDALVEVCHLGENIFDKLRNQELRANAQIMDLVLQVLDVVNGMFDEVRGGRQPTPAGEHFLDSLRACSEGRMVADVAVETPPSPPPVAVPPPPPAAPVAHAPPPIAAAPVAAGDEITDDEFERLLDQLHGSGKGPGAETVPAAPAPTPAAAVGGSDLITDDEFEALLDQLHGSNKGPAASSSAAVAPPAAAITPVAAGLPAGDSISDGEFEALLDQLHGKGKGPTDTGVTSATPSAPPPAPAARAVEKSEARAATPPPASPPPPPAGDKGLAAAANAGAGGGGDVQQGDTTVRVDTKKLDDIMNMVGELVLVRNRLLVLAQASGNEDMTKAVQNLDVVTADLQTSVMQTRMQPIKKVFGRFPRVVRDLARSLKKEINLELVGEDTDLDKNMVEALADPLVHLVRNAIDHGIEMPDTRAANGKPRVGKVVLSAAQEGDHILLSITDDGRGMDPFVLKSKAVEKGLMDQEQADRLSETEAFNLIFMPGFSTKSEVSDISGRGVGMDVVKTRITQLNGALTIDSAVGRGSIISIKLPLTLAILPTLMVMVAGQVFALPLASVNEIFHLDLTKTNVVDGQTTIMVRGKALPLFYLDDWLNRNGTRGVRGKEGFVVLVQVGTQRVGFVVDSLIGQQEVVIKPLGKSLQGTPGMAGATITSDGGIALILDIAALLKRYARRAA